MDNLRKVAFLSVGRACGFAGFAIVTLMMGLSFDPVISARAGAILTTLLTLVLLLKSRTVLSQNYKKTELWLMLKKDDAPPEAYAQWATSTVLRDTYLWFAQYAAGVAIVLWTMTLLLSALL